MNILKVAQVGFYKIIKISEKAQFHPSNVSKDRNRKTFGLSKEVFCYQNFSQITSAINLLGNKPEDKHDKKI